MKLNRSDSAAFAFRFQPMTMKGKRFFREYNHKSKEFFKFLEIECEFT